MKFEATFESLRQYSAPKWFRDAKFGIWSHWAAAAVVPGADTAAGTAEEPELAAAEPAARAAGAAEVPAEPAG